VTPGRLERYSFPKELLINLTLRELRSKFKRSTLGWLWSVINPAVTIAVYAVVFSVFLRIAPPVGDPSGLDSYAFFLMCGLLPWLFTANGILGGVGSLTANGDLIKKVWFPRWILPSASTLSWMFTFLIELAVLSALLILFAGNMVLPWLPVVAALVAVQFFFVLGMALIISPINVYFRDVEHFTLIFINVWFWGTPVLYPESQLLNPDGTSKDLPVLGIPVTSVMKLNPMAHFVEAYRNIFYNLRFPGATEWVWMIGSSIGAMLVGILVFRRLQSRLAEEL
jgi:ABC-2 type transport system permease protein